MNSHPVRDIQLYYDRDTIKRDFIGTVTNTLRRVLKDIVQKSENTHSNLKKKGEVKVISQEVDFPIAHETLMGCRTKQIQLQSERNDIYQGLASLVSCDSHKNCLITKEKSKEPRNIT